MSEPVLVAHGITVRLPAGWDGRIVRARPDPVMAPPAMERLGGARISRSGTTNPVVHLANFPLPARVADYGTGTVEGMGTSGVFVALVEFDPEACETPMFAAVGVPRLRAGEFDPDGVQRPRPGLCGTQRWFQEAGRAFCCYTVLGSFTMRRRLTPVANQVLGAVRIGPRSD